ncbi:MAG: thioredoxin family protein [Bacteroidota bacterium]
MKEIKNNNDINNGFSVILFMTPNCVPCKSMKKVLEEMESSHSDKATFYAVNTEENEKLARKYNIRSVPTTVFKNGKDIKDRFAGFIENVDLENKLMNLLFDFGAESDDFMDLGF